MAFFTKLPHKGPSFPPEKATQTQTVCEQFKAYFINGMAIGSQKTVNKKRSVNGFLVFMPNSILVRLLISTCITPNRRNTCEQTPAGLKRMQTFRMWPQGRIEETRIEDNDDQLRGKNIERVKDLNTPVGRDD